MTTSKFVRLFVVGFILAALATLSYQVGQLNHTASQISNTLERRGPYLDCQVLSADFMRCQSVETTTKVS